MSSKIASKDLTVRSIYFDGDGLALCQAVECIVESPRGPVAVKLSLSQAMDIACAIQFIKSTALAFIEKESKDD